ncbi:hypothetical protein MUK42_16778 [Musa troglodytarum]|uniref:Uncharacterized protein n=1 Tax=Musa troglodytarum TaxID=320322 RepID=A0A9E7KU09_9LILI|nr:hypothetical protein MUK42_16778 [Musa troglodytarum]URE27170.1 hypothetical protein MUK42_16778 [Musa troglodytarum]
MLHQPVLIECCSSLKARYSASLVIFAFVGRRNALYAFIWLLHPYVSNPTRMLQALKPMTMEGIGMALMRKCESINASISILA